MAVSKWYGKAFLHAFGADGLDVAGGALKALLTTSTYTPDQDAHEFLSSVTNEIADASYARVTLTGVAVSYDAATNKVKITSDPIVFAALDDTFRTMVLFVDSGVAGTSPLVKWTTFDADQVAAAVDVTITPDATDGLSKVTVS